MFKPFMGMYVNKRKPPKLEFSYTYIPRNRGTREPGNRGTREPGNRENKEIKKPPDSPPDDLAVVYRDIPQFWDQYIGLLQYTNEPQNVHFPGKMSEFRGQRTHCYTRNPHSFEIGAHPKAR